MQTCPSTTRQEVLSGTSTHGQADWLARLELTASEYCLYGRSLGRRCLTLTAMLVLVRRMNAQFLPLWHSPRN